MKKRMSLNEIFCARGTDKGTYHSYGPDYEEFIDPEAVGTLLEIGVWTGCSMLAWHDWLPEAEIWGIDILDEPVVVKNISKVHHILGSATDPLIVETLPKQFDIIIDDGSHLADEIKAAIDLLWPRLVSGGWYIVEDLFVTPGLAEVLVARVQPVEHHFQKHHGEILFMRKN